MADWLVDLGASTSFADAARELAQLSGLQVCAETIRQYTEDRGRMLEDTDQDGWHEVKRGLVGGQVAGDLTALSYVAARQSAEAFGPRLLAEAAQRGALEIVGWDGPITGVPLATSRSVVVLGDGAHWIWELAAAHFGAHTEIVDFSHATQHVWTIAHALFGEGSWLAAPWANFAVLALSTEGAGALPSLLDATTAPSATATTVLTRERQYFRANQARMDYPAFRQQGLPIGSGAVESAGRHLVQLRLKRAGARWSDDGGQAVLNVRGRLISGRSLAA